MGEFLSMYLLHVYGALQAALHCAMQSKDPIRA